MSYSKFSALPQSLLGGGRNGGRSLEESISNIINNPVIQNRVLNSDLNPCQVDITRLKPLGLCNCSLEADIPDVPLACNMTSLMYLWPVKLHQYLLCRESCPQTVSVITRSGSSQHPS